ncbi:hypothetical protein BDP27DRAFT_1218834 [Rhodocollybia butyracea]|uniref:BRCT domain-containing protein n=1 Tax=Rhodocollybia butyracea TaxID=206335 RepID=A0A9P5PSR9_9AGAR|nr:hypothetical protein BDP27DRAFT_1218834 [Rhodocollybia butyracea]
MPLPKRPANEIYSPILKRKRSSSPNSGSDAPGKSLLKVFIIDAKLDAEVVEDLRHLIDNFGTAAGTQLQLCPSAEDAQIVITDIHMQKRIERHVNWDTAKQKAIVTPQWLRDSFESKQLLPCGEYAALRELYEETIQNCPEDSQISASNDQDFPPKAIPSSRKGAGICYNHHYSCMRYSPLICPNQKLVEKLAILRRHREVEGLDIQALGYERAISVPFPRVITTNDFHEVSELPHIGRKILSKIQDFIQHGDIPECRTILNETRYQSLVLFNTVYGIGPSTARALYSSGLRTIKDLERHYGVTSRTNDSNDNASLEHLDRSTKTGLPDLSIKVGLELREELIMRIPRSEVEEIRDVVMNELAHIRSGCVSTITGGYRRGKIESNDIDIVISHKDLKPGDDQVKGLCAELIRCLYDKRLLTHVMYLSSFREHNTLRTTHWDSLQKALTVFILPDSGKGQKRIHRRLDLIFALPEVYHTAIVGWTGSTMFERDLRLWAKEKKGMKFDSSGISRRHDSKLYFPKSEEEVFELLDLEFIEPALRNADL